MTERPVCLDIGIGKGGRYIEESSEALRVGLDLDRRSLRESRQNYKTLPLEADASGECALPLATGSIQHIDLVFPCDELLYGLCYSDSLWKELQRILKQNGDITILVDQPFLGIQAIIHNGVNNNISCPQHQIISMGEDNGFSVSYSTLSPEETNTYGTDFSDSISRWQEGLFGSMVYRIIAQKP